MEKEPQGGWGGILYRKALSDKQAFRTLHFSLWERWVREGWADGCIYSVHFKSHLEGFYHER
jgi:hypothetical protein